MSTDQPAESVRGSRAAPVQATPDPILDDPSGPMDAPVATPDPTPVATPAQIGRAHV